MSRLPHGRFPLFICSGLLLVGAAEARAQIHPQNYKQINPQFSTGSATGVFLEPDQVMGTGITDASGGATSFVSRLPSGLTSQINSGFSETLPSINQRLTGSRSSLPSHTFDTKFSPLNGDMNSSPMWKSNFPMGRNFSIKMAPSSGTRQPLMSSNMQRISSLNDDTAYDRWKSPKVAPDKFTDSFVFHTTDNSKQLEQVGQQLSLQDINRYQFQGSFSSQPGLPITHAAGDADQVVTNNGQLLHSPKLFDFGARIVPSGGNVAPRIITSDGSRPYLPSKQSSTHPTSTITRSPVQSSNPGYQTAPGGQQSTTPNTGAFRGEIPKNETMLPQGKYQFTTPDGNKVPVELDAPEVIIETEN